VSVSSLWADEGEYYPVRVEPYTPSHYFEKGKADPGFRTKLKIAEELVDWEQAGSCGGSLDPARQGKPPVEGNGDKTSVPSN
jgi:hypothetical protein